MSTHQQEHVRTSDVIGAPHPDPEFAVVGPQEMTLPQPYIPQTPKPPTKSHGDPFWTDDVEILWKGKRWTLFFPREQDTYAEKLNSVTRAGLYISIVLMILYLNIGYVWIGFATLILTVLLWSQEEGKVQVNKEGFEILAPADFHPPQSQPAQYVFPTKDNPMMNVLQTDYRENPNRESISKVAETDDPTLKTAIDDNFYHSIFRDVSDVYSTVATQRNHYTVPVTTIPNDQKAFAEFCYGRPPTCKEGNGFQCWKNTDREDYLRGGSRPVQL